MKPFKTYSRFSLDKNTKDQRRINFKLKATTQKYLLKQKYFSGLLLGSGISRKFAAFLEENDLFVPDDDDVDWSDYSELFRKLFSTLQCVIYIFSFLVIVSDIWDRNYDCLKNHLKWMIINLTFNSNIPKTFLKWTASEIKLGNSLILIRELYLKINKWITLRYVSSVNSWILLLW